MIRRAVIALAGLVILAVIATTGAGVAGLFDVARTGVTPALLADLAVSPEDTGAHYDRDQWGRWAYHGDGCDTREVVMRERGRDVETGKGCIPVAGTWVSPYTGDTLTDPYSIEVDHLVAVAEANRSGTREWSSERRYRFANDPVNLRPVEATINRQKSDQGPESWLPEHDRCGYARAWVEVKAKYGMTVDRAERDALAAVLSRCDTSGGDRSP